jgi:hypothetical protein
MNLYELVNTKEYENKDISIYIESENTEELFEGILDSDDHIEAFDENINKILESNDVVIVSRVCSNDKKEWYIDPLNYGKGQVYNETDICFVQEEILDEIDFDKVESDKVVIVGIEEDEESDWLDEITHDLLNDVSELGENECVHCLLKKYLKMVEDITRENTLDEVIDNVENM